MVKRDKFIAKEGVSKFSNLIDEALSEEDKKYTAKDLVHDHFDDLQKIIKVKGYDRAFKIFADSGIKISRGTLRNYMSQELEKREFANAVKSKKRGTSTSKSKKATNNPALHEQSLINELRGDDFLESKIHVDGGVEANKVSIPSRVNPSEPELAY